MKIKYHKLLKSDKYETITVVHSGSGGNPGKHEATY